MNLYALLGRFLHVMLRPFFRLYTNKRMTRVRAVIINEQDEILMVRSWFGHQWWSLPGGGVKLNEPFNHAIAREVLEETGLKLEPEQFTDLGSFPNPDRSTPYMVNAQFVRVTKQPVTVTGLRWTEVLEVSWQPLKHLPARRSPNVDLAIDLALGKR